MRAYHSSRVEVSHPDIAHSRDYLDFGLRSQRAIDALLAFAGAAEVA